MSSTWTCGRHTRLEKSGTNEERTRIITVGRVRISITSLFGQSGDERTPYPFRSRMAKVELKNQVENLRLLIATVEADLARKQQSRLAAKSTEVWFLTLQERVAEVEEDTEEAC
jgi:hypothetical protein